MKTINLSIKNDALYPQIINNIKYFSYFQSYLGVLDDIHILAHIPAAENAAY